MPDQLKLYYKHLSWLHAVPDGQQDKRNQSRGQMLSGSDLCNLPKLDCYEIPLLLGDIGLTRYNGVQTPVTYQEIHSFCSMSGITATRQTLAFIRELSETYVNGLFQYKDKNCNSPYYASTKPIQEKRDEVANKFKSLAASRNKK